MFNTDLSLSNVTSSNLFDDKYSEVLDVIKCRKKKVISSEYLSEMLSQLETHGIPNPQYINEHKSPCYFWFFHLSNLKIIESFARKSEKFSFEEVTKIFHSHFENIKKQGFSVHQQLLSDLQATFPLEHVSFDTPAITAALIKAGANVNHFCYNGFGELQSPLYSIATTSNQLASEQLIDQTIEILTDAGCDPNGCNPNNNKSSFPLKYSPGFNTPLAWAAISGREGAIKSLIKVKADVNFGNTKESSLLLKFVSPHSYRVFFHEEDKSLSVIRILVEAGTDLFVANQDRKTAEEVAREHKRFKIASFLNESAISYFKTLRLILLNHIPVTVLNQIIIDYLSDTTHSAKSNKRKTD